MKYGALPIEIGLFEVDNNEMMFFQDMPIKLSGQIVSRTEKRLINYREIINKAIIDFKNEFGQDEFEKRYIYICVKNLFQKKHNSFNREGWHSDGFMSNDITYIWSNKDQTIFNCSDFNLTQDHFLSMDEMMYQAKEENDFRYPNNTLVRLNQFNIHRVADVSEDGIRAFVKVSFSKDKFDLIGNSHNYELDYNWEMKPRLKKRNIPQSITS